MKLEFSRQIFEKSSNVKFHQNLSSGSPVVPYRQTDMKPTLSFGNFAKAPKNEYDTIAMIFTERFKSFWWFLVPFRKHPNTFSLKEHKPTIFAITTWLHRDWLQLRAHRVNVKAYRVIREGSGLVLPITLMDSFINHHSCVDSSLGVSNALLEGYALQTALWHTIDRVILKDNVKKVVTFGWKPRLGETDISGRIKINVLRGDTRCDKILIRRTASKDSHNNRVKHSQHPHPSAR